MAGGGVCACARNIKYAYRTEKLKSNGRAINSRLRRSLKGCSSEQGQLRQKIYTRPIYSGSSAGGRLQRKPRVNCYEGTKQRTGDPKSNPKTLEHSLEVIKLQLTERLQILMRNLASLQSVFSYLLLACGL